MTTNFPAPGSLDAQQLNTVFESFSAPLTDGELSYMDTTDIEIGTPFYISNFNVSYNVADWYAKESNILTRVTTTPVGYQILRFNNVSNYILNFKTGNRIKITNLISNASSVVTITAATVSSITIPVITEFPIHGNISIRVVNLSTEVYTRTSVTRRNIQSGEVFVNVTAPRNNLFLSEVTPTVRGVRFPDGQRLNSIQSAVVPANLETYIDLSLTGEKSLVITDQSPNVATSSSNLLNWYAKEEPILTITTTTPPIKVLYFASQFFIPFRKGSTVRVKSASGYIGTFTVLDCTTTSVTLDKCGFFATKNTTVDNLANTVRKVTNTNPIESSLSLRNLLYSMTKSNNVFISRSTTEVPQSSTIQKPIAKVAEVITQLKSEKLSTYDNVGLTEGAAVTILSTVNNTLPITGILSNVSSNVTNWYAKELDVLTSTYTNPTTITLFFNQTNYVFGSTAVLSNADRSYVNTVTIISSTSNSITIAKPAFDFNFISFFNGFFIYLNTTFTFAINYNIPYRGYVKLNSPVYSTVVPVVSGTSTSITVVNPTYSLNMVYTSFESASLTVYPSTQASSMSHTREKINLVSSRLPERERSLFNDLSPKPEQTPKLELFFNVPRFTENVNVSTSSTDTTIPITFSIQAFSNNVVNWYATDGNILKLTAIPLTTLTLYFNNTIGITTGSTIRVIEYTSKFFKSLTVLSANSYSATVAYDLSIIKNNLYVYVKTTLAFTQKMFIPYAIEGAVVLSLPNNTSLTTNITERTASSIAFVKTYFVDTTGATISDSNPSYYPQRLVVTNQLPLTPRENLYYAIALPYYRTERTVKIAEEPKTFSIVGKVSKFKSDQYQGFVVPKNDKVQSVKFSASATSVTVGDFSSLPKFSTVPTAISAPALGQTVYNTPLWYSFELNILQRQTVINATTKLVFNNASYAYLFAAGDTVKLYRSNYTTFVQVLSATLTTITFATPVDFPTDTLGLTIQNYSSTVYPKDITFTEMAPLGMPRDVALPRQNLISAEYIKPNQRGSTDFNIERDAVVGRNLTTTSGLISQSLRVVAVENYIKPSTIKQFKVDVVSIAPIIKSDSLNKPLMTVVSVAAKTDAGKIKEIFKISADSNILYENQGKVITSNRLTTVDSINKISGVVKQFKVDRIAGVTSEPAKIIVSPITPIQFWN